MAEKPGKDVVARSGDDRFPLLAGGSEASVELRELMEENLGGGGLGVFDLDRVTVPAGGGTTWELEGVDGPESTRSLEGVVVAWTSPRAYWSRSLDDPESEGGSPPDCVSDDSVLGYGAFGVGSVAHPSGECATCPMNEWGSDPRGGNAKACKEGRQLFMALPNRILPVSVSLAPTSIQPLRKYFLRLAGGGLPYYSVVTRLELERVDGGQIKYSVVKPTKGDTLDEATRRAAKEYGRALKEQLASTSAARRLSNVEEVVPRPDASPDAARQGEDSPSAQL